MLPLLPAIWAFHVRRPAEIRRMLARIEHGGDGEKGNYMNEVVEEDKMNENVK